MIQLRDTFSFGINDTNSFDIIGTFRNNANRKTDIQINDQYQYPEPYRARRRAADATAPDEEQLDPEEPEP